MHWYGDPAGLQALARRVNSAAQQIREEAGRVAGRTEALHWESTRADAFRAAMAARRRELEAVAARLDSAAGVLLRHAAAVERHVHEIAVIERAATTWFGGQVRRLESVASGALHALEDPLGAVAGVVEHPPWEGWRWSPRTLPAPGHKDWLEVGRFLRSRGVHL